MSQSTVVPEQVGYVFSNRLNIHIQHHRNL